jgi:hypothetical protein
MKDPKDRTTIRGRINTEIAVEAHDVNNEMGVAITSASMLGRSIVYLTERGVIRLRNKLNALLQAPRDTISPIQRRRRRSRR